VLALTENGIKTLQDFAECADWEIAGGTTEVDGKSVKDTGILESFDISQAEAMELIMQARVECGIISLENNDHTTDGA
jgi:transcription termination/antitermination protein NusA